MYQDQDDLQYFDYKHVVIPDSFTLARMYS